MIPSPDGSPVPPHLTKALDYHAVEIAKLLHQALEASRCTSTPPDHNLLEHTRLVGYASSDLLRYAKLLCGLQAVQMQAIGYSTTAVARYLQIPVADVPQLATEEARQLFAGLINSPDPHHDSCAHALGRSIASWESADRDRTEVALAALFHNPDDPDSLRHLPTRLQDAVQEVAKALDTVAT